MTDTGSKTQASNAASSFAEDEPRRDAPEQLSLFVNLDGFEGPIDLL